MLFVLLCLLCASAALGMPKSVRVQLADIENMSIALQAKMAATDEHVAILIMSSCPSRRTRMTLRSHLLARPRRHSLQSSRAALHSSRSSPIRCSRCRAIRHTSRCPQRGLNAPRTSFRGYWARMSRGQTTTRSETILVRAAQATATTLDLNVHLKPWGSCKHTQVKLGSIPSPLKHEGGDRMQLVLTAHDSDNLVITKTELKFAVSWVYLDSNLTKAKAQGCAGAT